MEVSDFIPTKASALKNVAQDEFKAVTFISYKPKGKRKKVPEEIDDGPKPKDIPRSLNIKKTKQEIIKFGMSGFDSTRKEEAKVQLAIKLGAKPPKKEYKNYKQLLEKNKKVKAVQKRAAEFQQLGKNNSGKSTAKGKSFDKKRKKAKGILDIYGKVRPSIVKKELSKRK